MRSDSRERILQYWWALELFSPQKVPALTGRSAASEGRRVIAWRPGEALPWTVLRPPQPRGKRRWTWRHTAYLGIYELEEVYQYLHRAFAEDPDAYDERPAGRSACAAVQLDSDGRLIPGSAVLSSALWAVARIRATGRTPDPQWASAFSIAYKAFAWAIDIDEGHRREAAHAERVPAHDEASLRRLVQIAHEVSGIAGHPRLAGGRIVIESRIVPENPADDLAADTDFLNSFFLDDLAAVQADLTRHGCPPALAAYLAPDADLRKDRRSDVMTDHAAADAGVRIERLPRGRWPSKPEHTLALRQQFAVNQALTDLSGTRGLMGVNGPPGTGKTTMLRDVLAGNVVERARRLASLRSADDAFVGTPYTWRSGDGYCRVIHQLRQELTGFEMVVASANNAAVENITLEVPARDAIAERWRQKVDYFADIASATLAVSQVEDDGNEEGASPAAWGLVAARLGNRGNRDAFRRRFWFDYDDRSTGARSCGMQTRLKQWKDGVVRPANWVEACADFWRAHKRVDTLIALRADAQNRREQLEVSRRQSDELAQLAQRLVAETAAITDVHRTATAALERAAAERSEASRLRDRQVETKPGVLETLLSWGRAMRDWRARLTPMEQRLWAAEERYQEARAEAQCLERRVHELSVRAAGVDRRRAHTAAEITELRRRVDADREALGAAYPDDSPTRLAREMRAPWLDAELDQARSELFIAALRLHEDFVANAAEKMLDGLRAAIDVVAGRCPRDLTPEKIRAAWQTFFLVVPLVSTTFASVSRMFAGLGPQVLGWLLIDEAGQAPPQYAVGAIWRAQRVVAVGDPLQLQPVVTMPSKARLDIATAFGVSAEWIPPRASAQSLADRTAHYGTSLVQGERRVWVSAPLTVHRRCDEPMFGLCNELAYGGMMVSGVQRRVNDPEHPDFFDGPDGPRLLRSQWLDTPATDSGTHLQRAQVDRLCSGIEWWREQGLDMSEIIAISPFRAVADELRFLERKYPGMRAGTIHTAQGREADVVFLVLGGAPDKPGAKTWASQTVNLVNVAVSRAKRRLYIIGDRAAWSRYAYFDQVAAALGPASRPGEE
ncbi:MAG: AAA domain-containing protein [Actinomyces sp.]|uniref:DEAD/DEAH box helicase n=1 Tax=Actinomyces sp. TaxID=29317 RepID=UPI0026DD5622|nr:ATP-binding protein [Actinomyces sp.]MDO4242895.1 AAA domain-containing protein [Actinomyces sp.]